MKRFAWVAATAFMLATPATAAEIDAIRLHLFYEATGRLSPDIASPASFTAWNTIIGEGDAEEPASDLLVAVVVRADGHQFIETPLRIRATNAEGRLLGERVFDAVLTSDEGVTVKPLWLSDVGCEEINVIASMGSSHAETRLVLDCGE